MLNASPSRKAHAATRVIAHVDLDAFYAQVEASAPVACTYIRGASLLHRRRSTLARWHARARWRRRCCATRRCAAYPWAWCRRVAPRPHSTTHAPSWPPATTPVPPPQYNPHERSGGTGAIGGVTSVTADMPRRCDKNNNGSLIAVSYEARARGVKRNMRGDEARRVCPELELVQVPTAHGKADLQIYRDAGAEARRPARARRFASAASAIPLPRRRARCWRCWRGARSARSARRSTRHTWT